MLETPLCQSCGMEFGRVILYGTNLDGTQSVEFCKMCFDSGNFLDPDITMTLMIERQIKNRILELGWEEFEAEEVCEIIIPRLKRWRDN